MHATETLGELTRRFAADRRGNFVMLTGVAMAALAAAVGLAVDVSQSYHLRSSMRAALDAAVTSTARDITTGKIALEDARASVEKLLNINGRAAFSTQGAYTLDTLTIDRMTRTIEATAFANVDLAFPLFKLDEPRVSITSAAIYSDKQIEVAMMLDVTGSMEARGRKDKIGDLRSAAANAVMTMLDGQREGSSRIRVALIPYASGVNVGELAGTVFEEKPGGPDLPPAIDAPILASSSSRIDNCATERKLPSGSADFSDDGPDRKRTNAAGQVYRALVNRDDRLVSDYSSTQKMRCPAAELMPLTADKDRLLASIEDYEAAGTTAGAVAIQWTYYMLSPKWRRTVADAGLGAGPAEHDARRVSKVAILMTDGLFNTAYAGVGRRGTVTSQAARARANAEALCRNMRQDGIEIFTIGFDLGTGENDAKRVLRNCASADSGSKRHYFEASTGEELDAAFQEIIRSTEKVALTK